jgi:DNA-binding HxlR family transcriptional regulator
MSGSISTLASEKPHVGIISTAKKEINIDSVCKSFKKVSNSKAAAVVRALRDDNKGKTFRELQTETKLIVNDLNHAIYDMKQLNLIVTEGEKKGEVKYRLTSYCVALLDAIDDLQELLHGISDEEMFSAHKVAQQ